MYEETVVMVVAAAFAVVLLPFVILEYLTIRHELRKSQNKLPPPTKEEWKIDD